MSTFVKFICLGLLAFLPVCLPAQTPAGVQKNAVHRLTHINDSSAARQYRHSFTYDPQGRPLTHKWEYLKAGKLLSTLHLKYTYDEAGRLVSKTGETSRYRCYYNANGALVRLTQELLLKGTWELCEDTQLTEIPNPGGNDKRVSLTLLKRTSLPSGKMSEMEVCNQMEYTLDKSNNIQRVKVLAKGYRVLAQPVVQEFYHDNKPNPVQNMFVDRWYQIDLENGGLTNVVRKREKGRIIEDRVYAYNAQGYPVSCTINGKWMKKFSYTLVEVPAQEEPATVLAAPVPEAAPQSNKVLEKEANPFVLLYPNPATRNFTIKADNLGKGGAVLRVIDYSTARVVHEVSYQVENQLEALITTDGMPPGLYIIELTSASTKISQRLVVH